jgi:hypothetical protein
VAEKYFGRAAKMRGIYIIVEGQTEEEFVYTTLRPYLNDQEIYDVRAILVETSPGNKGGDLKYVRYKRNIENLLKREGDIIITSLIDFFRLRTDFPKYEEAKAIVEKQQKVKYIEDAIKEQINNPRFIPYIQLHEFEGLLFSDIRGFEYIPNIPLSNKRDLEIAIAKYPNPELLNDGDETAPSKRLSKLIPGYQKTLHGPLIADEIGIGVILEKCPRFNKWVNSLINAVRL